MKAIFPIVRSVLWFVGSLAFIATACDTGNEGDRCNPSLSHDECGAGLSCQQPTNCPENYCCPTSGTGSNPYCQPGCAGGLASICVANPSDPACSADAGSTPGDDADTGEASDDASDAGTTPGQDADTGVASDGASDASVASDGASDAPTTSDAASD